MNYGKIAIALVLLAHAAQAQTAGAQAETLFRQGKDLMAKGKYADACAAFDASQKLAPAVSTLLNQAACREKNNQLATAWGLFLEAERQTRGATDEHSRQFHQVAASKAAKLEPRLSTLTISVAPDSQVGGLQITRGGEPVDPGAWNKALPVDGGSYEITASAPGNTDWSSTITVGPEHDVRTIDIPKLKAAVLEPPKLAAPAPARAPAATRRSIVLPLALGGAALVIGGTALGFELWARSTYDEISPSMSEARRNSLWRSANHKRYAAQGLGIAAIGTAGAAAWLYFRSTSSEAPSANHDAALHIAPMIAGDRAGVVVLGHY